MIRATRLSARLYSSWNRARLLAFSTAGGIICRTLGTFTIAGANSMSSEAAEARWTANPDWIALLGIFLTVVLSFVLRDIGATGFFIAGAVIFWATYVCLKSRLDPSAINNWGFRTDNLGEAATVTFFVFLIIVGILIIIGGMQNTLAFPTHLLAQLAIYPAWGLIQQFLALAIVVGNLERTSMFEERKPSLVILTALLFSAVHLYDVGLATGCFLLELMIVPLYFRYRNLLPLGILHGWTGALYYLWVLNEDLWNEIVAGARAIVGI
jgi:hypothetical protein